MGATSYFATELFELGEHRSGSSSPPGFFSIAVSEAGNIVATCVLLGLVPYTNPLSG